MKRMDDEKRRQEALKQGRSIVRKRYGNPAFGSKSLKENVESELGNPAATKASTMDKRRAAKAAMDQFMNRKFDKLPRLSEAGGPGKDYETGGPKEDLQDISGQLGKASKLHGNQSKRVAKIAEGMKSETGNPYMKRSKSKYGM